MKRVRIVMLAGLLAGACLGGPSSVGIADGQESGEESGGPYQNYITWNMCQSVCHMGDQAGRASVTSKLYERITSSATDPRAVATQEMCRSEFDRLSDLIDGDGYASTFYPAKDESDCPGSGVVGNALFWRESCTTGCRVQEPFGSAIQAPSDGNEDRGYACGRTYSWDAWYCSVHITSKTDSSGGVSRYYQREQIAFMRIQSATWRQNGRSTVMMGDFNVRPDQAGVGMGMFYDLHVEADSCSTNATCRKTHEVVAGDLSVFDRKFDYVFASDTTSADTDCDRQGSDPAVVRYASRSDHTFLRGYILCPNS